MKKNFEAKIYKQPRSLLKLMLIYICCIAFSSSLAFGVCYAYFSAKVSNTGSTKAGTLTVNYIDNSQNVLSSALIYISRSNVVQDDGTMDTVEEKADTNSGAYTYFLPGDKIIIKGKVQNPTSTAVVDYIDCYVLLKIDVKLSYKPAGSNTTQTRTDTVWYNLSGTKLTVSGSAGNYTATSGSATRLAQGSTVDLASKIGYTLSWDDIDNSYSDFNVEVTFTINAHQADNLENSLNITNILLNQ